jgi:putative hydrolase of the HAD superfamily
VDLYLFDFDKTLYGYNFLHRLPALSHMSGVSQYDLASQWWAAGYESRAEAGEWPDAEQYLEKFREVTGARLTLAQWQDARAAAMTPIPDSIAALRRASTLGTVSLFSNNPSIFARSLPRLAPDVAEILGPNVVTSCLLRARKPMPVAYERVLAHYGAGAADTFFADDNRSNVAAALALGIHAHHVDVPSPTAAASLDAAITAFAARNA